MRYEKDHKEDTRRRIVQTAAKRFREHGFAAAGLKATLAAAGLTNGAFYNHFRSKDELAREAVTAALRERTALLQAVLDSGGGVETVLRNYFSIRHRDNPGAGCPSSAYAAEVARQSYPVREAYAQGVDAFLTLMQTEWPGLPADERRRRAVAIYSLMVGAMQRARAQPDEATSKAMLESGLQTALAIAGAPRPPADI